MVLHHGFSEQSQTPKRRRGIILSSQGWQRLQAAELLSAARENRGHPYTLEQLSDRTGLSSKTLTKVRHRQQPVDQPTLEAYFAAFSLSLTSDDIISQEALGEASLSVLAGLLQAPLQGQLSVDSPFYIYRPPAEKLFSREIFQPAALIRVQAPRQFGKTSLITQGLIQAKERGLQTTVVSLHLMDRNILSNLNQFLQSLCLIVSKSLGLADRLQEFWNPIFGSNYSCTDYFESYLLPAVETPLLLVLDEVNVLFNYPNVATDFFGMLRAWHERSRHGIEHSQVWQKLRLVIVHSTNVFLPLTVHQSPFNVGTLIELASFTQNQVQELVIRYGLAPAEKYADQLVKLVGGHPYLTQLALFHLSQQQDDLQHFLNTAIAPNSIFNSHLRQQLGYLEEHAELKAAMRTVISTGGVALYPTQAFRLQGVGLIRFQDQLAICSCQLYQQYFSQLFNQEN